MSKQRDDHYSKAGAKALAKRIEQFWLSRGYRGVSVQAFQIQGRTDMWGVWSNMIGGQPPRQHR